MLVIACLIGVGFAFVGLAPTVEVALAIIAPMAILIGFINVQYFAWLQRRVAEDVRGRVMSLVMLGSIGLAPVSLAIAGALVDLGFATFMYLAAGALVVGAALVGFAWGVPAHMDSEPEAAP